MQRSALRVLAALACGALYGAYVVACGSYGEDAIVAKSDGGTDARGDEATSDGEPPLLDGAPPLDAASDAPVDACSIGTCLGTCTAGKCEVDCNNILCSDKSVCGGPIDCNIHCNAVGGNCTGVRCASTTGKCTFDCNTTQGSGQFGCRNIACASKTCEVTCSGRVNACDGVYVDGGANTVRCLDGNQERECNNVHCISAGGSCARECVNLTACDQTASCGPPASCTSWSDGGN